MKIKFVLPGYFDFPIGGHAVVYHYANYLARKDHDVEVVLAKQFIPDTGPVLSMRSMKRRLWPMVTRYKNRPLISWFDLDPRVRFRLVHHWHDRVLRGADVVVATAWQTANAVARAKPSAARAFYLMQHYETWAGPKAEVDATFGLGLHVIAISQWLVNTAKSLGSKDITHIPNGLDHSRFRVTAPIDRPAGILTLNHDAAFKGVPDALAVLERVHREFPEVPVRMFGLPKRDSAMPEWIEYFRNPAPDELVKLYNAASIYLSASLAEGWALPPAEAMACGCLFVGTDNGGCREFAEHGRTALLSIPGDREALYNNLHHALADPESTNSIRNLGTQEIAGFNWQASGESLDRLFNG